VEASFTPNSKINAHCNGRSAPFRTLAVNPRKGTEPAPLVDCQAWGCRFPGRRVSPDCPCWAASRLSHCSPALLARCGLHCSTRNAVPVRRPLRLSTPYRLCRRRRGTQQRGQASKSTIFPFPIGPAARPWVSQSAWQTYRLISGLVAAHSIANDLLPSLHPASIPLWVSLVEPVERTKDLRRASEIPSSANRDLHANEQIVGCSRARWSSASAPNSGSAARATSWSIREVRTSTRLGSTKTPS
jgi:hypothetical protein